MDSESLLGLLELIGFLIVWFGVGVIISFGFTASVKKLPKLYTLLNLPIVLYPYGYMIAILVMFLLYDYDANSSILPFAMFLILHPIIWGLLIMDLRVVKIASYKTAITLNMVTKLVHIPAYIFHFILGAFGSLASVWGIGFVLFAIVIDLFTIAISGTFSLAAIITLYKQKRISKILAIVAGIASYIYCIDVVVAIILKVISSREKVNKTEG